jgi:hypothetical protein
MVSHFADNHVRFLIYNSYEHYVTTVKSGGVIMYGYLLEKGLIKRDPEQIKNNLQEAAVALRQSNINNASVINYAKALCVDAYFLELKLAGIDIRDIVKGPVLEMNK